MENWMLKGGSKGD